jgi:hypothetical protein
VIDLSDDDDDDDDINETDIECRYSVTRQSGLFFVCMLKKKGMIRVITYLESACFLKA